MNETGISGAPARIQLNFPRSGDLIMCYLSPLLLVYTLEVKTFSTLCGLPSVRYCGGWRYLSSRGAFLRIPLSIEYGFE